MTQTLTSSDRKNDLARNIGVKPDDLKHLGKGPFEKGDVFEYNGRKHYTLTKDEARDAATAMDRLSRNNTPGNPDADTGTVWIVDEHSKN